MNKCIACGGTSITEAFKKHSLEILRCSFCGLGRTSLCAEFDPQKYYSEAYFQGGASDGYADYVGSEETLRAEFRRTVKHLLGLKCKRGRLLEFGCAYGFFLAQAMPYFQSVHGIELSEDAVRFCRSRGIDVTAGVVDTLTLQGPYDVAVGLDVIEHVPEPHETVKLIASHMNPGGTLVMTTGDWAALLPRLTGPNWRLMTPPQHLSFFTYKSMQLMLASAGLRVISLSHPWKQVPLSLITYQLQRIMGIKPRNLPLFNKIALPVNLWDAMRVVALKE